MAPLVREESSGGVLVALVPLAGVLAFAGGAMNGWLSSSPMAACRKYDEVPGSNLRNSHEVPGSNLILKNQYCRNGGCL